MEVTIMRTQCRMAWGGDIVKMILSRDSLTPITPQSASKLGIWWTLGATAIPRFSCPLPHPPPSSS
jgi:hypothetical protein